MDSFLVSDVHLHHPASTFDIGAAYRHERPLFLYDLYFVLDLSCFSIIPYCI